MGKTTLFKKLDPKLHILYQYTIYKGHAVALLFEALRYKLGVIGIFH